MGALFSATAMVYANAKAQLDAYVNTQADLDVTMNNSVTINPELEVTPTTTISPTLTVSPEVTATTSAKLLSDLAYNSSDTSTNYRCGGVMVLVLLLIQQPKNAEALFTCALYLLGMFAASAIAAGICLHIYLLSVQKKKAGTGSDAALVQQQVQLAHSPDVIREATKRLLLGCSPKHQEMIFTKHVLNNPDSTGLISRALLVGNVRYMVTAAQKAVGDKMNDEVCDGEQFKTKFRPDEEEATVRGQFKKELARISKVAAQIEDVLTGQVKGSKMLADPVTLDTVATTLKGAEGTFIDEWQELNNDGNSGWFSRRIPLPLSEKEKLAHKLKNKAAPHLGKMLGVSKPLNEEELAEIDSQVVDLSARTSWLYAELLGNPKFGGKANDMLDLVQELGCIGVAMADKQRLIEQEEMKITDATHQQQVYADVCRAMKEDEHAWKAVQTAEVARLESKREKAKNELDTSKRNEQQWTWHNWGSNARCDMYTRDIELMRQRIPKLEGEIRSCDKQILDMKNDLANSNDSDRKTNMLQKEKDAKVKQENAKREKDNLLGKKPKPDQTLPEVVVGNLNNLSYYVLQAMYDLRTVKLDDAVKESDGGIEHVKRMQAVAAGMKTVSHQVDLQCKVNHEPAGWAALVFAAQSSIEDMRAARLPSTVFKEVQKIKKASNAYNSSSVAKFLANVNIEALGQEISGATNHLEAPYLGQSSLPQMGNKTQIADRKA